MANHTIYHKKTLQEAANALRKRHSETLGVRPAGPFSKSAIWSIKVTNNGATLMVSWFDEAANLRTTSEVL